MTRAVFVAALLAATPALAHPGHEAMGFGAGFAHPLGGWDHLAAMIAVGALAGLLGGSFRWWLPGGFLAGMVLGGALGMAQVPLPMVEAGILASVVVLGVLVAAWMRLPLGVALPLLLVFGLLHGHAHGTEMTAGDGVGFALGFVLATALLHGAGLLLARDAPRAALPLRLAGAAVAVIAGIGLAVG